LRHPAILNEEGDPQEDISEGVKMTDKICITRIDIKGD